MGNPPAERRPKQAPQPPKPLPAHLVAYVVVALVAVAGVLGGLTDAPQDPPGWALRSDLVYHLEVAGVLLAAGYLVVVLLVLGWDNATLTKLTLGPAGAEAPEKAAAAQLDELKRSMRARDEKTAGLLVAINERLDRVDPPADGDLDAQPAPGADAPAEHVASTERVPVEPPDALA